MDVQAYLDRIGYAGRPRVDFETLRDLHALHLRAIPYESFDVMLGAPPSLEPEAAFEKIVLRRRGGWCYEMNGLLAAVLRDIGFQVTEMAAAVMRTERGEGSHGNHLVLRIDLDRPYLADVGLGDGTVEPLPLAPGAYQSAGFAFRIEALAEDGWIRFHNHAQGGATYFDFRNQPADSRELAETCRYLSTSPDSIFTQTALAFRHGEREVKALLGRTLHCVHPEGKTSELIDSENELVAVLRRDFDLDLPQAASLWPAICAKHEELFGPRPRPGG